MTVADCQPCTVTPILFTTAKHCPQRWPTKAGKLHWRCPDPVAYVMQFDDGMGGAVCERHLAFYSDCPDTETA